MLARDVAKAPGEHVICALSSSSKIDAKSLILATSTSYIQSHPAIMLEYRIVEYNQDFYQRCPPLRQLSLQFLRRAAMSSSLWLDLFLLLASFLTWKYFMRCHWHPSAMVFVTKVLKKTVGEDNKTTEMYVKFGPSYRHPGWFKLDRFLTANRSVRTGLTASAVISVNYHAPPNLYEY